MKPTPQQIAEKFTKIDAHDDTVEGYSFQPAIKRGKKAKTIITLFRRWENMRRGITFHDCVIIDSDVLVDNAPNNTNVLEATADLPVIEQLMRRHKKSWNVHRVKNQPV